MSCVAVTGARARKATNQTATIPPRTASKRVIGNPSGLGAERCWRIGNPDGSQAENDSKRADQKHIGERNVLFHGEILLTLRLKTIPEREENRNPPFGEAL